MQVKTVTHEHFSADHNKFCARITAKAKTR